MKQINLEEILNKVIGIETKSDAFKQEILNAMREACNQTVDLCVENAAINFIDLTSDKVFDYSESKVEDLCIEFAEWINSKMDWNFENEYKTYKQLFEQFLKERK